MKKRIFFCFWVIFVLFIIGCTNTNFEIQFVDYDDSIIETYELKKNDEIVAPSTPSREGYEFSGWDKEFDKAKEDMVIKAEYTKLSYIVKFIGLNDEVLKEEIVLYGDAATAPIVADTSDLRFVGWDEEFVSVKSNLEVKAKFENNSLTVKFYGYNGELLKEQIVKYGESAIAPVMADIDGYEFSGWDKEYNNVLSNLEVNAIFVEKVYTLTFYDGATVLNLDVTSYKVTDTFSLPVPTKSGYEFIGWFLSDISLYDISDINSKLKGNLKLYSRWVQKESEQLVAPVGAIEFNSIKKNPHSSGVGFVYQPEFPVGAKSTSVLQYTWASSNTKIAKISAYSSISVVSSGYAIITGTYISDPNYVLYAVVHTSADGVVKVTIAEANEPNYVYATFKLDENTTIKKIVTRGGSVIPPTANSKEGFKFNGWVGTNGEDIYNITKDTTFVATYIEANESYAGKTISILGDSISTFSGYIPSGFSYFYPYPTADIGDMNQTWWMKFINKSGMKLLVNNSWSGSAVAGSEASAGQNKSRLEHLYIGEVTPDVIMIFMGANDAPSKWITTSQFDIAYGNMLANIKERSPNSEIIICTLPSLPLFTAEEQADYNAIIRKHANNNGLTILDFEKAFTRAESSNYLVDSAHPNKAGMEILADVAINDFSNTIK